MRLNKVMTIVIAFHGSGARTFKDFYTPTVLPHWRKAFANWVSDRRLGGTDAVVPDIDIDTANQPNVSNHSMLVATVLPSAQFNRVTKAFV